MIDDSPREREGAASVNSNAKPRQRTSFLGTYSDIAGGPIDCHFKTVHSHADWHGQLELANRLLVSPHLPVVVREKIKFNNYNK